MERLGLARLGKAGEAGWAWLGVSTKGTTGYGSGRQGRQGYAPNVSIRLGASRQAGLGTSSRGRARHGRSGSAGKARSRTAVSTVYGNAGEARVGGSRPTLVSSGKAGYEWCVEPGPGRPRPGYARQAWPVRARKSRASQGVAGLVKAGVASLGLATQRCAARQASLCRSGLGKAWRGRRSEPAQGGSGRCGGSAGMERHGKDRGARRGAELRGRFGSPGQGQARSGSAGQAWPGTALSAWRGTQAWLVRARSGVEGAVRPGRLRWAGLGSARSCRSRQARQGTGGWDGLVRQRRRGWERRRSAGHGRQGRAGQAWYVMEGLGAAAPGPARQASYVCASKGKQRLGPARQAGLGEARLERCGLARQARLGLDGVPARSWARSGNAGQARNRTAGNGWAGLGRRGPSGRCSERCRVARQVRHLWDRHDVAGFGMAGVASLGAGRRARNSDAGLASLGVSTQDQPRTPRRGRQRRAWLVGAPRARHGRPGLAVWVDVEPGTDRFGRRGESW